MEHSLAEKVCHDMAADILNWLGQGLFFGTLLAAATWLLIRLRGRSIPPAVETLLWAVVLIKFLLPVGGAVSFDLFAGFGSPDREEPFSVVARSVLSEAGAATWEDLPAGSPQAKEPGRSRQAAETGISRPAVFPSLRNVPWVPLAGAVYVACAAALICLRFGRHTLFVKKCRALPPAGRDIERLTREACRKIGVRAIPSIRVSADAPSSFVTGFFSPLMVLAQRRLLRRDELENEILHEVAHLRRGDARVRYLQCIAGSLLFFWPVVAWVNRRIDIARECACDKWALRRGRLTAGEYARSLLNAVRPHSPGCLASDTTSLASNRNGLERRIDMILDFSNPALSRKRWTFPAAFLLLFWGAALLAGAAGASAGASADARAPEQWPATVESVKAHAVALHSLVAARGAADINGDGVVAYNEKDAYLVALAMNASGGFMAEFPYADRSRDGRLDYLEVYGVIRGITLIAYADRRPNAAQGARLDLVFYHKALDAQKWLLDNGVAVPAEDDLHNIFAVVKRIQGRPETDHHRKLDHGGPMINSKGRSCRHESSQRFAELQGNIAMVKAQLGSETDPREAARLRTMLAKLEAIVVLLEKS